MSLLGNGLVTLGSQIGVKFYREREREREMWCYCQMPTATHKRNGFCVGVYWTEVKCYLRF